MTKTLYALLLSLLITTAASAQTQTGHEIHVKIDGIKDTTAMLGHHYGSKQYVIDTVRVNSKGEILFAGNDTLPGGIYLVVIPQLNNKYFEMIISGNDQHFSLQTDTLDFVRHMKVIGSKENEVFYQDMNFIAAKKEAMAALKTKMDAAGKDTPEGESIKSQMQELNKDVENARNKIMTEHPDLFYAKFLKTITDVHIPEAPMNPDGTKDSTFALRYIQKHYFDNIDFNDERLLRTNMFDTRIHKYFEDYVYKVPDSIIKGVDFVIARSAINKKIFQYVTVMLLNDYATSKMMGFDAVYVHIVDKYYSTGKAYWLDDIGLYRIQQQAERVRPTLLGKTGQPMILQDADGHDIPLYSVDKRFTVILFWSPTCGHCKKELPKVEKLYPELKELGAEIYAVYSEEEYDKWEQWLKEHPYPWINVADRKNTEMVTVKYNVDMTPLIFVLDKNKKIIGKKISIEQVPDLLKNQIAIEDKKTP